MGCWRPSERQHAPCETLPALCVMTWSQNTGCCCGVVRTVHLRTGPRVETLTLLTLPTLGWEVCFEGEAFIGAGWLGLEESID